MRASRGIAFAIAGGKPRSSVTAAIGIETFIVSGRPQTSATALRNSRASATCAPLAPRGVGELEDALGTRVERTVHRMAEAGRPAARGVDRGRHLARDLVRRLAAGDALAGLDEQPCAQLGGAEDDRAAAEDPGRHGALQRIRVGGQRHARRDVGGHHPVLGDRHEQEVEEVALVVVRLATADEQVEVVGEASPGP